MTWQFVLVGLGLGLIVGLTGVGGGSLMTPILIIFFNFSPPKAVGTDIFHGAIFKTFGAWRHRRLGTVHGHLALWLFAGSGPLAIAGAIAANVLKDATTASVFVAREPSIYPALTPLYHPDQTLPAGITGALR